MTLNRLIQRMRLPNGIHAKICDATKRVDFIGGSFGTHSIYLNYEVTPKDVERVIAHWNGYAAVNDSRPDVGDPVRFWAGILRRERVLAVRKNGLAVQVKVHYKNGNVGKPRWIEISKLR